MGIDFLSGYGRMQSYYKTSEIQSVNPEEIKKQEELQQSKLPDKEITDHSKEAPEVTEDSRKRTTDLENISLTFHKENSFDYIGSESGLTDLDMQKAISDMQKDQVLQEYQYFVGSAKTLLNESPDGQVLKKLIEPN